MPTPKPIYQPGDPVHINVPGDIYHGRTATIVEMSPSTRKQRDNTKQWRYLVDIANGDKAYYAEKHLEKI